MKIKRDAFLYLDGTDSRFAQCGTCVLGYSHCRIMGNKAVSAENGSCCLYMRGRSVLTMAIANLTKAQVGYVERQVRCRNCKWFISPNRCGLYAKLNRSDPDTWDLDDKVIPLGCCNAQSPR